MLLAEEKPFGHDYNKIVNWLSRNGFKYSGQEGSHPKYTHEITKQSIPGINPHKGDVNANSVSNMMRIIKNHHKENGFVYAPIDQKMTYSKLQKIP